MDDTGRSIQLAIESMRKARLLPDEAGETRGAARLQHALNTVLRDQSLAPHDELSPDTACLVAGLPLAGDTR